MSSTEKSEEKKRKKIIKFSGGPRDGEEIEWTKPERPKDEMYFHSRGRKYEYFLASRYSDDNIIEYLYVLINKEEQKQNESLEQPDDPYYPDA